MKILVIGDVCDDVFIYGVCERLCPEAPVPVFKPTKSTRNLGMAGNVYNNLLSLDVNLVDIVSNKEKMTNLLNQFMTSPLHIQGLLILWSVCVVLFYSTFVYIMGTLLVNTLKKVF